MLQKFNKLAMCLISAITITSAYPSEYIVIGTSEKNKEKIYDIVSKFRFPSILSPFIQKEFRDRYQNYNLIETFKTKEAEYKFLQTAIREIDNKAEVNAITKSEYQFTAYDYFAKKIARNDDTLEIKSKFKIENYLREKEEWGLTRACSRFMADKKIKDIFWKVNDHAKNLYMKHKGKTEEIINEIFDAFRDKQQVRAIDDEKLVLIECAPETTRIGVLTGRDSEGKPNQINTDLAFKKLKQFTLRYIQSERDSDNYVVCHAGDQIVPELAETRSLCFSDGLGSGFIFDDGASAYALSVSPRKLFKLELNRGQLLRHKYPIFIPPAHHLLSACGCFELFHIRTQVVDVKITDNCFGIDKRALNICGYVEPLIAGCNINQTPEYVTEQILTRASQANYSKCGDKIHDNDGAERLKEMLGTITEVPEEEITLR